MVEIRKVESRKDRRLFTSFILKLYKDNPNIVPKLFLDEMDNFNPKKNPAFEFCDVVQFLAFIDGKCVGRIGGIYHKKANDKWNDNAIRFTRVDFIDDFEVSSALFRAIEDWGRSLGATRIIGPIGFTDYDQQGMLLEGFDYPSNYITIYNHEYYIDHMVKLGYLKEIDWVEYRIGISNGSEEKLSHLANIVEKRTKTKLIEFKSMRKLKPFLRPILDLVDETYKDLHGVVELNDKQKAIYINQLKLVLNPEYVKIILDEENSLVGFGFGMPSFSNALKKSNGRLLPFGWLRFLLASRKKGSVLDLYLVGVKDNYQTKGLPAMLMHAMHNTAKKNNVPYAESGPELENNTNVQSLWKFFDTVQHIRRRCWVKQL